MRRSEGFGRLHRRLRLAYRRGFRTVKFSVIIFSLCLRPRSGARTGPTGRTGEHSDRRCPAGKARGDRACDAHSPRCGRTAPSDARTAQARSRLQLGKGSRNIWLVRVGRREDRGFRTSSLRRASSATGARLPAKPNLLPEPRSACRARRSRCSACRLRQGRGLCCCLGPGVPPRRRRLHGPTARLHSPHRSGYGADDAFVPPCPSLP